MRRWLGGTCALVVACSLVAALTGPAARADTEDRLVAPGVESHAFTRGDAAGPQEVRVLRVHMADDPHLRVAPILASDTGPRRAKVTDLVLSSGAIAAVNGN